MKNLVYGFSGESNSGKTTLIVRLVALLQVDHRVVVLKHDPKSKAKIDTEGKDSDLFYRAGADIVLLSPTSTTLRLHTSLDFKEIVSQIGEVDYLFVEGLKTLPIPKIALMREKIESDYLHYVDAIAIGDGLSTQVPYELSQKIILNINDIAGILEHVQTHAYRISTVLGGEVG